MGASSAPTCTASLPTTGSGRAGFKLLGAETSDLAYEALVDDILDRFADHLEAHLDCERLFALSAR